MKYLVIIILFAFSFFFVSCELPDTEDTLDDIPAVWAVFTPEEPVEIFITQVVPFSAGDSTTEHSFISGAELTLSWQDDELVFVEDSVLIYPTYNYEPVYILPDTFRVVPGRAYTLTGNTSKGNFNETFTVPNIPEFIISPDTAVFDNQSEYAFACSVVSDPIVYEYEISFHDIYGGHVFLPDSIVFMDCYELRWLRTSESDAIGVPWCNFYYVCMHEATVYARNKKLYDYLNYYWYLDDGGEGIDDYRTPPGGEGYTGVIGAYSKSIDTVWIEMGI